MLHTSFRTFYALVNSIVNSIQKGFAPSFSGGTMSLSCQVHCLFRCLILSALAGLFTTAHATDASTQKPLFLTMGNIFLLPEKPAKASQGSLPDVDMGKHFVAATPNRPTEHDREADGYKPSSLSPEEKSRIEFIRLYLGILANAYPAEVCGSVIDIQGLQKLEIIPTIENFQEQKSVLSCFPVQTIFGLIELNERALTLSSDIPTISKEQALIKFFVEHPKLRERAERALNKIQQGQTAFLKLYAPNGNYASGYYFSFSFLKRLNTSVKGLAATGAFDMARNFWSSCLPSEAWTAMARGAYNSYQAVQNRGETPLAVAIAQEGIKYPATLARDIVTGIAYQHSPAFHALELDQNGVPRVDPEHGALIWNNDLLLRHGASIRDSAYSSLHSSNFFIDGFFQLGALAGAWEDNKQSKEANMFGWVITGKVLTDLLLAYSIYNYVQSIKNDKLTFAQLETQILGIALLLEGLQELLDIAHEAQLPELDETVGSLAQFFEKSARKNPSIKQLINLVTVDNFKNSGSLFTLPLYRARLLVARQLLEDNKLECIPLMRVAGNLDASVAAAHLVTEHQGQGAPICFVEFSPSATPHLELHDFWNVLVSGQSVVTNSITLGGASGDHNLLFTGPNGGGKSTIMKAIAQSIVSAQAFGIGFCSKMVLAPKTNIYVYLNEKENISQGLSTFMAEKYKFDSLILALKNLQPNERAFLIMDEALKGTVEDATAELLSEALIDLATLTQSTAVIATHTEKPARTAETLNGAFTNVHVEIVSQEPEMFTRTFKLVRGIPEWWFTDAVKRRSFINWLSHEAAAKAEQETVEKHDEIAAEVAAAA